jgi:hypothetical protein
MLNANAKILGARRGLPYPATLNPDFYSEAAYYGKSTSSGKVYRVNGHKGEYLYQDTGLYRPTDTAKAIGDFDGVDDYMILSNGQSLNPTDKLTLSVFVKGDLAPRDNAALLVKDPLGGYKWLIYLSSNGIRWYVRQPITGIRETGFYLPANANDGQVHCITCTFDKSLYGVENSGMKMYYDNQGVVTTGNVDVEDIEQSNNGTYTCTDASGLDTGFNGIVYGVFVHTGLVATPEIVSKMNAYVNKFR